MNINIDRLMQSMETMWQIGATANGGVHRLTLTEEDRAARDLFGRWCQDAGLSVRIDDFGNMYARRAGMEDLPPIMIGSHLDTVPRGGRYDGALGVLAALEVVRTLNDGGIETKHPIEIVNWTAEEGSRFRPPLFGSTGALGLHDHEMAMGCTDAEGLRFGDELERIGYAETKENRVSDACAYLELHIEQGPILESEDLGVGVVEGIIGQTWHEVTVRGRAGHAGANPMHLRRDALVAAATMILEIRRLALAGQGYCVATVGQISVSPGAMNVVPAEATFTIDVRTAEHVDMLAFEAGLKAIAHQVEIDEGVSVTITGAGLSHAHPVAFDPNVMTVIRNAMTDVGLTVRDLWSGAGHDAGPIAGRWPTGMIFVRSQDGLSHAEAEYSAPEDIEAATNVLLRAAVELAG